VDRTVGTCLAHLMINNCCLSSICYDMQIVEMGNKKRTNVDNRDTVKWTERWDDLFVDALVRQQSMGNRIDRVFTTKAYDNTVKELREKIGKPFEKYHLKNCLKTLKHNFNECYDLFKDMNGFTWSPETKMWNANPEAWKALIKVCFLVLVSLYYYI
jgi:hypothetical protein